MTDALPHLPTFDADDDERPLGVLEVERVGRKFSLPLVSVAYRASVCERIADVTLVEVFDNPYPEPLEAVYTFPLSGGSAVRAFTLEVAGRTIRGVVKERGEARVEYRRAIEAGKRAALLEQERDNVFTMTVGNLPPGERATVTITYSERLELFDDGRTELRLPLVVAPRYVPGRPLDRQNSGTGVEDDTDAVPDASRINPPRLASGSNAGPDVAIEVSLLGEPSAFADLSSSQHATSTSFASGACIVKLAKANERANRDFVLRWRFAGERVRSSLAVYRHEERGLFGMLTVAAPPSVEKRQQPRDVVFVLDRSGSMGGVKMGSAARAATILLETLGPRDRFAVAAFDSEVLWMDGPSFTTADRAGVAKGAHFLRSIEARGGTEIARALGAAFDAVDAGADRERAPVVVLVTDGQVSNESEVLLLVEKRLGRGRVFTVGIDTTVNDAFLGHLARAGRGTCTLVAPGAELEEALGAIARDIGTPEVVGLAVEDLDAGVHGEHQAPERFPDLFSGRAATVFLKLESFGAVRLHGRRADGGTFAEEIHAVEADVPAIAHLWARARIGDLEDRYRAKTGGTNAIKDEIVALSIAHEVVSRFTAYLAVDEAEIANPSGDVWSVAQPVEMPDEWAMPRLEMAAAPMYIAADARSAMPPPPLGGSAVMKIGTPMRGVASRVREWLAPKPVDPTKLAEALEALVRAIKDPKAGAAAIEKARVRTLELARGCAPTKTIEKIVRFLERGDVAGHVDELETVLLPELKRTMGAPFWE